MLSREHDVLREDPGDLRQNRGAVRVEPCMGCVGKILEAAAFGLIVRVQHPPRRDNLHLHHRRSRTQVDEVDIDAEGPGDHLLAVETTDRTERAPARSTSLAACAAPVATLPNT